MSWTQSSHRLDLLRLCSLSWFHAPTRTTHSLLRYRWQWEDHPSQTVGESTKAEWSTHLEGVVSVAPPALASTPPSSPSNQPGKSPPRRFPNNCRIPKPQERRNGLALVFCNSAREFLENQPEDSLSSDARTNRYLRYIHA